MDSRIGELVLHWTEAGDGPSLVVLHGVGVDHREIESALEPILSDAQVKRIYVDLPGMGRSSSVGLSSNRDVVDALCAFIESLDHPVVLLGHSYGAYLARGIAERRPELIRGLALVCPLGDSSDAVPEPSVVSQEPAAHAELEPRMREGFDNYFVVRTVEGARRYRDALMPGKALVDQDALERIFADWELDFQNRTLDAPTLVIAGRRDSTVGYEGALTLSPSYPRSTVAVVDDAGHALLHERPEVARALLADWVRRATHDERTDSSGRFT